MDGLILMAAFGLPAVLIWRYRALGVLISIPLGWAILALLLVGAPSETWADREFKEDWPTGSALLSLLWCTLFGGLVTFGRWRHQRRQETQRSASGNSPPAPGS